MYAKDFEYDGQSLSDYNCIVCDFDGSSGAVFASAGSSITNQLKRSNIYKNRLENNADIWYPFLIKYFCYRVVLGGRYERYSMYATDR